MRMRVVLFSLIFLATWSLTAQATPATKASLQLRVATFNVQLGVPKIKDAAAVLRPHTLDVIVLQETTEVGARRWGKSLASALGLPHYRFVRNFRTRNNGAFGNAVLSRFPVAQLRSLRARGTGKRIVRATVFVHGVGVDIYGVHFVVNRPFDKREPQRLKARLNSVAVIAADRKRRPSPYVVLGDFNSLPGGRVYRAMSKIATDACKDAGATWPATSPGLRIDQVWTKGLASVSCVVERQTASDHRPLIAVLRFN